jgi:hypothetical protein
MSSATSADSARAPIKCNNAGVATRQKTDANERLKRNGKIDTNTVDPGGLSNSLHCGDDRLSRAITPPRMLTSDELCGDDVPASSMKDRRGDKFLRRLKRTEVLKNDRRDDDGENGRGSARIAA